MDLQFQKTACSFLRQAARAVQNEEQTQELKLPEAMPDIGKVLCAWGQCMIRGKEWRKGAMTVSGGVTVWVLYQPEDETEPRSLESWVPFQARWDFPETQRDGTILVSGGLRSVDARTISARKLMLRVNLSLLGEALVPDEMMICSPEELPADIELLKRAYPACIPAEAGEKSFHLEDELTLPDREAGKVVRVQVQPRIEDRKLMGDKVVFRGSALVHLLYKTEDGALHTQDWELPFSQYSELEREYDDGCVVCVIPLVTGVEQELTEQGAVSIKIGLTGQYVVYRRQMMELVEDCYSTGREASPKVETLILPMVLDTTRQGIRAEMSLPEGCSQVIDASFYPEQPVLHSGDDTAEGELRGQWHILYQEENGAFSGDTLDWEQKWELPCHRDASMEARFFTWGHAELMPQLAVDTAFEGLCMCAKGVPMITALELGEEKQPDPQRPSLIVKRFTEDSLWNLAKVSGSTVEAILRANKLTQEPEPGKMLLIPIS